MSTASIRSLTAALVVTLSTAGTLLTGVGPAAAHAGHGEQLTASTTTPTTTPSALAANPTTASTPTTRPATDRLAGRGPSTTVGGKTIRTTPTTSRGGTGGLELVSPSGGVAGLDVECLVDFDDDLVLQYSIPNAAEDTFMTAPWYQACYDTDYYPAIAVKPMEYGHFHLGYQDSRVGPCAGDQTDWGRKQDQQPAADDPDFVDWILADCVSDIDPVTEPRSGIRNHVPGHRAQVFAYDGDGHLPFQLRTLQVIGDDVEVCHLPPGPWEAAGPGGSPWQCLTVGQGYWDLSDEVDNAIEVRIEYLGYGMLDNIGIDLLEG